MGEAVVSIVVIAAIVCVVFRLILLQDRRERKICGG